MVGDMIKLESLKDHPTRSTSTRDYSILSERRLMHIFIPYQYQLLKIWIIDSFTLETSF
jgi:hypothetical protein